MKVDVTGGRIDVDWSGGGEKTKYSLVVYVGGTAQYLEVDEPTFQKAVSEARHTNQLQSEPDVAPAPVPSEEERSFGGDFQPEPAVVSSDPVVHWPSTELDDSIKKALWVVDVAEDVQLSQLENFLELISRFTEVEWQQIESRYNQKVAEMQGAQESTPAPLVQAPSSSMRSTSSQPQSSPVQSSSPSVSSSSQDWVAQIPGLQNPLQRPRPARTVPMDEAGFPIVERAAQPRQSSDAVGDDDDLGQQA